MAGSIKGIAIEIGGETQKLTDALKNVVKESKGLQSELKQVDQLLKLNPGNTELLAQKQQILAEAVGESRKKLDILKESERQLNEQFQRGSLTAQEYEEQHRALQREVLSTENRLEDLQRQQERCNVTLEHAAAVTGEFGRKATEAGQKMMPASAAVAGLGVAAVKVGMDFDSAMSQVAATMGITTEEIANGSEAYDLLRQSAKDAGATTAFSASEAAEALNYLALAGYDAEKASAALVPILNLAAAGNMELAAASDMVTDSMSALGIEATTENLVRFGDEMVKASQKSNTSVAQLGEAYLTVGGTAQQLAGGTNELSTALGILADSGIKASEGGTHLRNIILSLTPTTDPAIKAFDQLGVSAYDLDTGAFRPLNDTFKDLSLALSQLDMQTRNEMLSAMFNKTDLAAISAMLAATATGVDDLNIALETAGITTEATGLNIAILQERFETAKGSQEAFVADMEQCGLTAEQAQIAYAGLDSVLNGTGARFDELSGYIADSAGAMQDAADTQLANLQGDLTLLSSQLAGIAIDIAELLMPTLRALASAISDVLTFIGNLSEGQKKAIVTIGLVVAAIGPLLIAVGKVATGISAVISVLPVVMSGLSALVPVFAALTGPIGAVITIVGILAATFVSLYKTNEDFRNKVNQIWDSLKNTAVTVWNGIKTTFTSGMSEAKKAVTDGFVSLPAQLKQAGKDAIAGLLSGLTSGAEAVVQNITGLGNRVVNAFKEKLGIHSPSKVFQAIGNNIVEGLCIGVDEESGLAMQEIANLGTAILNTGDEISSGLITKNAKTGQIMYDSLYTGIMNRLSLYYKDRDARIKAMEDGTEENITQINKEIEATRTATDVKIKLYQQEYAAKIALIDDETSAATNALQERIDAINAQQEAENREEEEEEYLEKIAALREQYDSAETVEEREKLKTQITETEENRRKKLLQQRRQDEIAALRAEITDIQAQAAKKKAALQAELEAKQYQLEQQREQEIKYMQQVLALMQEQVSQKKELEELQTSIVAKEKELQTQKMNAETKKQTQADLNALREREKNLKTSLGANEKALKEFLPTIESIAKQYGNALLSGFQSTEGQIKTYLSGLSQLSKSGPIITRTATGGIIIGGSHADGLPYVPFDGYIAQLHQGEAVLTKQEAQVWRDSEKKPVTQIHVTQHIYSPTENPAEEQRIATRELRRLALEV